MNILLKIRLRFISKKITEGKVEEVLKILNEYDDSIYEICFYKGVCYLDLGEIDRASYYLELALSHKDKYECASALAGAYLLQRKWEEISKILSKYKDIQYAKQLIKISNSNNGKKENYYNYYTLVSKAMMYLREKDYKKSIDYLLEAFKYACFNEDKGKVYNQVGGIYLNYFKDYKNAEKYFKKAYNLVPNNKVYKKNLVKAITN